MTKNQSTPYDYEEQVAGSLFRLVTFILISGVLYIMYTLNNEVAHFVNSLIR